MAALITKALIEIPPKCAGQPPVNPGSRRKIGSDANWKGAAGLAEDLRHYGRWICDEAFRRIGDLYPKVKLPPGHGASEATVIAWLWARTVKCPNPACGARMPLVRSFQLSAKKDREACVKPIVDRGANTVRFEVRTGKAGAPNGTVNRRGATCIVCESPVPFEHIRAEGRGKRLGSQLMAIVAYSDIGRVYLEPAEDQEHAAEIPMPEHVPDTDLPQQALGFRVQRYGMTKHRDLFTIRQLALLTTLSKLTVDVRDTILADCRSSRLIEATSAGSHPYADSVLTYLGLGISKAALFHNTLSRWRPGESKSAPAFGRQVVSMVWDYAEVNPFAGAGGDLYGIFSGGASVLDGLPAAPNGWARQADAASPRTTNHGSQTICTDPPYYDNIGYADLADFFYVWLRQSLGQGYPDLLGTILTPKGSELIAASERFGGDSERARDHFETGLARSFDQMCRSQHSAYPLSLFYAFKQVESAKGDSVFDTAMVSTGWETMLEALIGAGFQIVATLPIHTEGRTRMRAMESNALATSVVLSCRTREAHSPLATRREFLSILRAELPSAVRTLQQGNIAPVDLAQAAIGPGMSVFSRYSKVLESDGSRMPVRAALALINQVLDETLAEQEGEFDADTRWALAWFEQYGFGEGSYDDAETLSRAKNTSVRGMEESGAVKAHAGKVRFLRRDELPKDWEPGADKRSTIWEATQYLVRAHGKGEDAAAVLLGKLGSVGEIARDLAYRLYSICERKKWAQEAMPFNALVIAWPEIVKRARELSQQASQKDIKF